MVRALRRRVAAVVAALSLVRLGDSLRFEHEVEHLKTSPYRELVDRATEWCYKKLVNDSNCCLDSQKPTGLRKRIVRRPGTAWNCSQPLCLSTIYGRRGDDHIWVPPEADCDSPRILYLHGGSWAYGSPTTDGYEEFTSRLARETGAMVMVVDYPLIHERTNGSTMNSGYFDEIMNFSVSALQWLAENGPYEGCPADSQAPLFVGGDSSGGGSALSLAMKLGLEPSLLPGRRLTGAFLYSPWTNLVCNSPEYYHNAFAKIEENTYQRIVLRRRMGLGNHPDDSGERNLTAFVGDVVFRSPPSSNSMKFENGAAHYMGDDLERLTDPVASPYYAEPSQLAGLPPMYIAVGSAESILGDSIVVAHNAAEAGVDVHLDIHPGMWHVFPMYSEGCGGDTPLWNAVRAMNSTALFVRHLSAMGTPPYTVAVTGPQDTEVALKEPHTTISYSPAVPTYGQSNTDMGRHLLLVKDRQQNLKLQRRAARLRATLAGARA